MQSGITASTELQSAFKSFLSDPTSLALPITIKNESLVPLDAISFPDSSSSFKQHLHLLGPYLNATTPLYIILRTASFGFTPLTAVTYIPNTAPVRQKTLFASTRATLTRSLGPEHFSESLFTTEADELTAQGWAKHEAHGKLEQPLTEEERVLGEVKRAEQEEGRGMGEKRRVGGGHLQMQVQDAAQQALLAIGKGAGEGCVVLKIDVPSERIVLDTTTTPSRAAALPSIISPNEPRYTFYRYEEVPGQNETPIVFIYTCPNASKIKERMLYSTTRGFVVSFAEKECGVEIAKKFEATSPEEITPDTLDAEFRPKVEEKQAFSRPKRPGRR